MKTRLAVAFLVTALALPASAASYIFPYVIEGSGTATAGSAAAPIDTSFVMTTIDGLAGVVAAGGANVDIYLVDAAGNPTRSATLVDVCNPCAFSLNATTKRIDFKVHDQIVANGGFAAGVVIATAVVVVGGAAPDYVRIDEVIRNATQYSFAGDADGDQAITSADVFYLINTLFAGGSAPLAAMTEVHELRLQGSPNPAASTAFLVPDLVEKKGTILTTQFTSDVQLYLQDFAGLGGLPIGGGLTVDIYLYQNSGDLMKSGTGVDLCNPCVFSLADKQRTAFRIEDRVNAAGGWGALSEIRGFAILRVSGVDPASFAVTPLELTARGNAFDLLIRALPLSPVTP